MHPLIPANQWIDSCSPSRGNDRRRRGNQQHEQNYGEQSRSVRGRHSIQHSGKDTRKRGREGPARRATKESYCQSLQKKMLHDLSLESAQRKAQPHFASAHGHGVTQCPVQANAGKRHCSHREKSEKDGA